MTRELRRHPALRRLDVLVGDWELSARIGGREMAGGRTSFAWLEDGAFLRQHTDAEPGPEWQEHSPFPTTIVIGLDQGSDTFSCLYADARGVSRVYGMRLQDGRWEMWGRPAADFFQRFEGTFGDGGDTIAARWERSPDGERWELDFELTYTRA